MKRMNNKRNWYVLSTGREFPANRGLISIAAVNDDDHHYAVDGFEIGEGYDGHIDFSRVAFCVL